MRTALRALLAAGWLLPAQAFAEEGIDSESQRWAPAFAITSGVLVQPVEADVRSGDVLGSGCNQLDCTLPPDSPIRPPASGDAVLVPPYVGGDFELMSPAFESLPGSPRFFAHAGAAAAFDQEQNVAKEGVPGPMSVPPDLMGASIPEDAIFGQGSQTSVETDPLVVTAGAGVAFTIDAFGRTLRIKPSLEYLREELKVTGVVHRAVAQESLGNSTSIDDFRLIMLTGSDEGIFHGLGPGLEIETDATRAGPFMASVFVGFDAYAILGNRKVAFSTSNGDGETASWSVEVDPWAFRAGLGVRLRLRPSSE